MRVREAVSFRKSNLHSLSVKRERKNANRRVIRFQVVLADERSSREDVEIKFFDFGILGALNSLKSCKITIFRQKLAFNTTFRRIHSINSLRN